ncbi:GM21228 [Drosophila sechellia]|uniref:GM21228 n=1 Tax=Drosophila sechellia TaxID=7238 RepID=B4HMT0_DROSE|nr:GM21228 [Drosophila sechellia]
MVPRCSHGSMVDGSGTCFYACSHRTACISYSLEIAAPRYPCSADAFHSPRRDDSDCDVPQISMRDRGAGSRMQDFVAQLLVLNTFRTFSSVLLAAGRIGNFSSISQHFLTPGPTDSKDDEDTLLSKYRRQTS